MKNALIVIAVLVVAFLGFILTRSGTFHVERSTKIDATPAVVFAQLSDFHNWPHWSAWEKTDPNMKRSYSGSAWGTGAAYAWEGDEKTGSGNMAITELKPNEHLTVALKFTKPYPSESTVTFTLKPDGASTDVRWALEGGNDAFMSKAMMTFMNMDKLIGPDFETGLKNLKAFCEAKMKEASPTPVQPAEAAAPAP